VNADAVVSEFFFKSRHWKIACSIMFANGKLCRLRCELQDIPKIIQVIRHDSQDSIFHESSMDCGEKISRDNATLVMPALGPRIGKQQMKNFYRSFRQQVSNGVVSFGSQDPGIVKPRRFANCTAHTA
jgi:hypothetical protein